MSDQQTWTWLDGETSINWDKIGFPLFVDGKPAATFTELDHLVSDRSMQRPAG